MAYKRSGYSSGRRSSGKRVQRSGVRGKRSIGKGGKGRSNFSGRQQTVRIVVEQRGTAPSGANLPLPVGVKLAPPPQTRKF